jgi:hypothetical protein
VVNTSLEALPKSLLLTSKTIAGAASGAWERTAQMTDSLGAKHFTGNTAEIVAAYVKNNPVNVSDLPDIITTVGESLRGVTGGEPASEKPIPAVSVRRSVQKDHIVCFRPQAGLSTGRPELCGDPLEDREEDRFRE